MGTPRTARPSGPPPIRGTGAIPPFFIAANVLAWLAIAAGWLRGGRVERFGAAVLFCDYALTALFAGTAATEGVVAASVGVITVVFIVLCFRSGRWWPFVTAAALMLCLMVYFLQWVTTDLSLYDARSARLGLWIVVYLSLISGVGERWLAGEAPASRAAIWRRRRVEP